VILLSACLPLAAQGVTQNAEEIKRFTDPANGVSFRYVAPWTLTQDEPYMFAPSIQTPSPASRNNLRALVFTRSIRGVASWPKTDFSGVEFGYDARPAASSEACRVLASPGKGEIATVVLRGVTYWHGTAGDGGMSQATTDDIYTTFLASAGSCLLFDLAVHSTTAPGDVQPRAMSTLERNRVRRYLLAILDSVRIPATSR